MTLHTSVCIAILTIIYFQSILQSNSFIHVQVSICKRLLSPVALTTLLTCQHNYQVYALHKWGMHFATSNSDASIIFTWKQNLAAINTGHTSKYFYFFYFLQITLFSEVSIQNKTQKWKKKKPLYISVFVPFPCNDTSFNMY